jgi:hypothetical protein
LPSDLIFHFYCAVLDVSKNGSDAGHVQVTGVVETLHTKTDKPRVGNEDLVEEDTYQAGIAASQWDSSDGKGDPVAAVGVYHLRERRSAGGTIKKGNALDVSP